VRAYARQASIDPAQRDRLIAEHAETARRIALHVARRVPDWISRDDLVAAALLGLAEAAERYDEARQEPFLAFAEKRIRGAVLDELRRGDLMPRRVRQKARHVGETVRSLEQKLGRPPEDEEVAAALGVDVAHYRDELEQLCHVTVSAFEPDDHDASHATESPAAATEQKQILERVRAGLGRLGERDQLILSLYYNEELTYAEIGEVLGVTISRVCQLHGRAVARLKAEIENPREVQHG
jgi:RNA polymerase sigma factor for flagellar operon FliA